jgi:hypothetical protein
VPTAIEIMQLQYHTMLPLEEFKKAVCWLLNIVLQRKRKGKNQQKQSVGHEQKVSVTKF